MKLKRTGILRGDQLALMSIGLARRAQECNWSREEVGRAVGRAIDLVDNYELEEATRLLAAYVCGAGPDTLRFDIGEEEEGL